ncbi:MAG: sensor histidine kinase KdpD [Holophagaceae bacterium]|nr:sensor histidine kinase KdpD [Holophagaceae bacterium]
MNAQRPDPDALLRQVQDEEARKRRAQLKVFFGAAPGVGKTYAMLTEARRRKSEGDDVVIGVVETHGRSETAALAEGLEEIPKRELAYRGVFYPEFDLDAALKRHPAVILMDELAHTNIKGALHDKRWQDVMELLDAGIDVYTTINVQHLESLRDVVAQITGIIVRESVPDTVLERADEVELVDLQPEELQQRLKEGKVYVPDQARAALDRFFRKGNLLALRELALRRTADRVDAEMRRYMASEGISKTWAAGDRLLVCVGPNEMSRRVIRATRRMAEALGGAEWMAVYVETPRHVRYGEEDRARIDENLRLAERLGAETVVLQGGQALAEDILNLARSRNVTKLVVGKPTRSRWLELLAGSLVDELVRGSGDIDVYVITGDSGGDVVKPSLHPRAHSPFHHYLWAASAVAISTGLSQLVFRLVNLEDVVMVYMLGIVAVAVRFGRGPSLTASLLSVLAFDFFFVPPYLTFTVSDFRHLGTFGVMLSVGLVIGNLTAQIRQQAVLARTREERTQALYRLSRELARGADSAPLVASAIRNLASQFHSQVVVLLPDEDGRLKPSEAEPAYPIHDQELGVARWVFEHGEPAGLGTDTLPGAKAMYLPMLGASGSVGVLGIQPEGSATWMEPGQKHLLEAFANQTALALERAQLSAQRSHAQVQMEREQMRNALLSSVSHDLRTPLGTITGAASALLDESAQMAEGTRHEMLQTIQEEAHRLHRLVTNLLDLTRLESGALAVHKEWTPMEEVVGTALNRIESQILGRDIRVELPPDLPLVPLDPVLFEQVVINLVENAAKFSPADQPITIKAWATERNFTLVVQDSGPGIPEGHEERIFEKLVRLPGTSAPGAGLGLAICRGIVQAHGGRIQAANRPMGGAQVLVSLPLEDAPPAPPTEGP